jgi:hypothetical protein
MEDILRFNELLNNTTDFNTLCQLVNFMVINTGIKIDFKHKNSEDCLTLTRLYRYNHSCYVFHESLTLDYKLERNFHTTIRPYGCNKRTWKHFDKAVRYFISELEKLIKKEKRESKINGR